MATKRFIYATNNSQIHYRFLILTETDNEYVCKDYDTTSAELQTIKFYIDKTTFKGRVDEQHKKWSFIVNEGWFASLNEEDVNHEEKERNIVVIKDNIKRNEERLEKLSQLDITINNNYKTIDFNDLHKDDELYLLDDTNKIQVAKVIGFITEDKINYKPLITCEKLHVYNAEVEFDANKKEYFINVDDDDTLLEFGSYHVFKDKEDCNLYLQNKYRETIISTINGTKRRIFELQKRLDKLTLNLV